MTLRQGSARSPPRQLVFDAPSVSTSLSFHASVSPHPRCPPMPRPVLATDSTRVACGDFSHVIFCGVAVSWRESQRSAKPCRPCERLDAGKFSDHSPSGRGRALAAVCSAPPTLRAIARGLECGRAGRNSAAWAPPSPRTRAVPGFIRPRSMGSIPAPVQESGC